MKILLLASTRKCLIKWKNSKTKCLKNNRYSIDALVNSLPDQNSTKRQTNSNCKLGGEDEGSSLKIKSEKVHRSPLISNSAFVMPKKQTMPHHLAPFYHATAHFNVEKPAYSSNIVQQTLKSSLKCENCGYMFKSLLDLNAHKQLHYSLNAKRPYKCHLCQVTFAKTDQLTRHMIVHQASELDSVCQICFSSFSRKQDLDRHMLFHSK